MRRCLATFIKEEDIWNRRQALRTVESDRHLQEGLVAYAIDQSRIRREMRATFRNICLPIARQAGGGEGVEWVPVNGMHDETPQPSDVDDEFDDVMIMHMVDTETMVSGT